MSSQVYNVPVVLPALRKEESYRQLVDALEYLDAVSTDIFNRISCRVAESRDLLTTINNRVNVAQAKIDKLRNSSSKATRVFSPPKYPAPDLLAETTSVYQEVNPLLQRVRKTRVEIGSRLEEVTREVMVAKKHPFLLDHKPKRKPLDLQFSSDDPEQGEGLGSLPRHLPSVSSLLLFNTSENPYKKYVLLDPLSGAKVKTRDNLVEEELAEAPVTITQGEELLTGPQDSVMYVPVMPELPELEVPDLLPSLPYVAADMFYTADIGKSIAPSLANASVPELPDLADPSAPAATAASEPSSDAPPPPPPPEPAAPPPPPITAALPSVSSGEEDEEGEGGDVGEGGDDRANLMDAIRKAGGAAKAGLKGAKEQKRERKAKKEEEAPAGGDLLGDLTAALGRRRTAMSGRNKDKREKREKEEHTLGGGSMMDNISKMIPVTAKQQGGGYEDEGGDW